MPQVVDIEQAVLLLEVEPPFDKRDIQLARRRLAKQWHPDIAPPGKQLEHERHLKAVNEAAENKREKARHGND
jgi:curved DNA-binding protein CbpA